MGRGIDDKGLKGKRLAMPYQGPIMERLTTADMCVMGPGDLNKQGREGKTSWDTTTYALVMAHNVYNHIQAVQEINRLADIDYATRTYVNHEDWFIQRNRKKMSNMSDFVPNSIIWFNEYVEKVLDPANPDPQKMLDGVYTLFLDYISFGDKTTATTADKLFDTIPDISAMASMDIDPEVDAD